MGDYTFSATPDATVAQINEAWEGMYDDLIKRLEAEIYAIMGPVGDPNEEPVTLYGEAATALTEANATIARMEAALREIIDASNNTGIEMGTVGMRVAERVEDIARAALTPGKGE